MNGYQNAQYKMMSLVSAFFKENKESFKDNSVLLKHVEQLDTNLLVIANYARVQISDRTGIYVDKMQKKYALANFVNTQTAALSSYATDQNNPVIFNAFDLPLSTLKKKRDRSLLIYAQNLIKTLSEHISELKPYHISQSDIVQLQSLCDNFDNHTLLSREYRGRVSIATKDIKRLISTNLKLLRLSLDNDMVYYKEATNNLYSSYQAHREIDDNKTMPLALIGKITQAEPESKEDSPLEYVRVTVRCTVGGQSKIFTVKNTAKGNYRFKHLPAGACTLTFEKYYYDTLSVAFDIQPNYRNRLDVQMSKSEKTDNN